MQITHAVNLYVVVILGFYEDVENHRFGVKPKRGKPKLGSDFYFEFVLWQITQPARDSL